MCPGVTGLVLPIELQTLYLGSFHRLSLWVVQGAAGSQGWEAAEVAPWGEGGRACDVADLKTNTIWSIKVPSEKPTLHEKKILIISLKHSLMCS